MEKQFISPKQVWRSLVKNGENEGLKIAKKVAKKVKFAKIWIGTW